MFIAKVFTLYPDYFPGPLNKGLYGQAMEKKIWGLKTVDIREYALDKHKTVDDNLMEVDQECFLNQMLLQNQ